MLDELFHTYTPVKYNIHPLFVDSYIVSMTH